MAYKKPQIIAKSNVKQSYVAGCATVKAANPWCAPSGCQGM